MPGLSLILVLFDEIGVAGVEAESTSRVAAAESGEEYSVTVGDVTLELDDASSSGEGWPPKKKLPF